MAALRDEDLVDIAAVIDKHFNGPPPAAESRTGFILLILPAGTDGGVCKIISRSKSPLEILGMLVAAAEHIQKCLEGADHP